MLPEYRVGLLLTAVAPSGVMPLVLGRFIPKINNNQITLGIAAMNFAPATALPCILGFIFHHVTNALWLYFFRK